MSESAGGSTAEDTDEVGKSDAVEVDRVMAHPVDHVWKVLTTNDGVAALLGSGARLGGKGEPWHAEDGSHGVWRSYHPLEQVRVSWHADADAPRSLVDLHLRSEGAGTRVMLRQEPAGPDSAATRVRWAAALTRLNALA